MATTHHIKARPKKTTATQEMGNAHIPFWKWIIQFIRLSTKEYIDNVKECLLIYIAYCNLRERMTHIEIPWEGRNNGLLSDRLSDSDENLMQPWSATSAATGAGEARVCPGALPPTPTPCDNPLICQRSASRKMPVSLVVPIPHPPGGKAPISCSDAVPTDSESPNTNTGKLTFLGIIDLTASDHSCFNSQIKWAAEAAGSHWSTRYIRCNKWWIRCTGMRRPTRNTHCHVTDSNMHNTLLRNTST